MADLLLGIDIGTSATKTIVIDDSGSVVASADAPHQVSMPRPGWSEQEPDWWWRAVCDAVRALLTGAGLEPSSVAAVGLSGQMHGSVFLPRDARPESPNVVRPALLWNDQRTAPECDEIEQRLGGRRKLIEATGNPALTGLTAPKILWLRRHEPEAFSRVAKVILPKDYIAFRLSGSLITDVGDGSGTLLLDPGTRSWSDAVLESLELDRSLLPECVESSAVVGSVSDFAAEATGLAAGTPVVAGSGDQMTGAVGAGIVREGVVSATLGTSGVVFAHAGPRVPDDDSGRLQIMCAAVPGECCVYGCMLSAAGALQWFRDCLAPEWTFEELDHEASHIGPGAEGLIFLPYLTGERCPHPDPAARGAFIGLTARHVRAHLTRAVLEGVAMGMGDMLDLVRALGIAPKEIRMSGGGAKSALWRTIHAAVFDAPVTTLNTAEGSAYGAAVLAGVGCGVWDSVAAACDACLRERSRIEPEAPLVQRYASLRSSFDAMYPALSPLFPRLGEL